MRERGITRNDVRWLRAHGIMVDSPARAGTAPMHFRRGYLGKREAIVAYLEDAGRVVIVTVMWAK